MVSLYHQHKDLVGDVSPPDIPLQVLPECCRRVHASFPSQCTLGIEGEWEGGDGYFQSGRQRQAQGISDISERMQCVPP